MAIVTFWLELITKSLTIPLSYKFFYEPSMFILNFFNSSYIISLTYLDVEKENIYLFIMHFEYIVRYD